MLQTRESAEVRRLDRLVVVQIDERHLVMPQHVAQAACRDNVLDVAAVPRSLGDDHLGSALALAQLDDRGDDVRIGVDHLAAMILDQVRLEDDALALERDALAELLVLATQY